MSELVVLGCGPATSLQDRGRFGLQRFGVSPAGAMDGGALALANALAGNPPATAAIELALAGGRFRVEGGPARLALAGAAMAMRIDDRPCPPLVSVSLAPGDTLTITPGAVGSYAYLAVAGGFALTPTLGSLSVHRRSGLGGRPLAVGDRLPLARDVVEGPERGLAGVLPPEEGPIRVILGPQDDLLTSESIEALLGASWRIGGRSDRMAYRLEGPPLTHRRGADIVSDGIATGAIQVPGSGVPFVLMRDRQTTGGYPKIATIITGDLARFAQLRPGDTVIFRALSVAEAVAAARASAGREAALLAGVVPLTSGSNESAFLLAQNLVDGVANATEG